MSFQPLNTDLATKVVLLANLQRQLMQNQNQNAASTEVNRTSSISSENTTMHPLLMPSLNVSPEKISAMLAALTPPSTSSSASTSSIVNARLTPNLRPNGSSFGWGNRERKMEENWRTQNRNSSTK